MAGDRARASNEGGSWGRGTRAAEGDGGRGRWGTGTGAARVAAIDSGTVAGGGIG